jgi:hypothetical protein
MEAFLHTAIATLVGAFFGSYLSGYMKRKGENLATHEDIDKLVAQVEATTNATKSIEASISNKVWDRQRQWELKRDAVYSVMQALGIADETLHFASLAVQAKKKDANRYREIEIEAWEKFHAAIDDFDKKRCLALIVCGKAMNDTLMTLKKNLRDLGHKLGEGEIQSYEEYVEHAPDFRNAFGGAFACARKELGIIRDSKDDGS